MVAMMRSFSLKVRISPSTDIRFLIPVISQVSSNRVSRTVIAGNFVKLGGWAIVYTGSTYQTTARKLQAAPASTKKCQMT